MTEKIIGYVLIILGIVIILYSAFDVYSVFTGQKPPITPFKLSGISLDLGSLVAGPEQQQELKASGASLKSELISSEVLNQPLNYAAHLLFMGFLAGIGYKLASLGVMLVRPIKVSLKAKEEQAEGK